MKKIFVVAIFLTLISTGLVYKMKLYASPSTIAYNDLNADEKKKYASNCFDFNDRKFIKMPLLSLWRTNQTIPYHKIISKKKLIKDRWKSAIAPQFYYYSVKPDTEVLKLYSKLMKHLDAQGYDPRSINITSFIRTPHYNNQVGGAKCSRHQVGDAIDIKIKDVNRDGTRDEKDVKIVYNFLDLELSAHGGLGNYEQYPDIIHFDTRSYKARWNY
jgi:hypothetical protein